VIGIQIVPEPANAVGRSRFYFQDVQSQVDRVCASANRQQNVDTLREIKDSHTQALADVKAEYEKAAKKVADLALTVTTQAEIISDAKKEIDSLSGLLAAIAWGHFDAPSDFISVWENKLKDNKDTVSIEEPHLAESQKQLKDATKDLEDAAWDFDVKQSVVFLTNDCIEKRIQQLNAATGKSCKWDVSRMDTPHNKFAILVIADTECRLPLPNFWGVRVDAARKPHWTQGAHGRVEFRPGELVYTPDTHYRGEDSFTMTDETELQGTLTYTVAVLVQ
jgi:hypothetical protein